MSLGWKEIHNALDRLVGIVRVKRPHAEVAGLGESDRSLHRLGIADLADENNVRRLAQRVLQRSLERLGVESDLSLSDDGFLMPMNELDRVFYRDNMSGFRRITVIDHGC